MKHLEDTVIDGVGVEEVSDKLQDSVITTDEGELDGSQLHIWGTKEKFAERYDFEEGDIMLFYTGDGMYTYAGVIRATEINEALAERLWGFDENEATEGEEPWSHIIYLDPPVPIEVEGSEIAGYADYNLNYVLGLQPLNDEGHQGIREEYGDIPSFIADNSELALPEVFERSAILERFSKDTEQAEQLDEDDEQRAEREGKSGLTHADGWAARCDEWGGILDRSHQLLLYGPELAISRASARHFAERWLDAEQGAVSERILEVSVDANTTYEDLVERTVTSSETNTGITTTDGVFKQACRLADAHKNEAEYEGNDPPRYVLLVELRNDVTLGDALGPIAYLLDTDSRRRQDRIQLPHTGETLAVPDNLYIIAVDAGASLSDIDTDTRRRFPLVRVDRDIELLSEVYTGQELKHVLGEDPQNFDAPPAVFETIQALRTLNEELVTRDEPIEAIGQERFIAYGADDAASAGQYDPDTILDIWQYELLPHLVDALADPAPVLDAVSEFESLPDPSKHLPPTL